MDESLHGATPRTHLIICIEVTLSQERRKSGRHKKVLSLYFIEWCCQGVSSVNGIQLSCVHSVERRNIYSHGTGSGISSGAVACCHTPDHCIELNITITGMSNKWLLQVITNKSYAAYTGLVIATR